jgi:hypothetical protein
MQWFCLAVVAYGIGHIISLMEMRAEHPEWQLLPSAIAALAWPYLVARQLIVLLRRDKGPQR